MNNDFILYLISAHAQTLIKSGKTNLNLEFHKFGMSLAPKVLEMQEIYQTTDLFALLKKLKATLDQFFTSKRSLNQTDDKTYFFIEYDLYLNRPNRTTNGSQIIAGLIEGCLRINRFDYKVTIKQANDLKYPNKLYFVIRPDEQK
ncbi:Transport protein particle (TRAPP) complex subunit [Pseudoloma neurophilia]|uniref:Transport protein particle (TRAPP) complex subunit n=1 Tax=Pseudoloma neurophilia TaxID=146866 RepID=A0A0R0M855_9MICR|nr:Transport protein particle (TRAPP) complex subunit [Pseudoloma neurophilia]